jgi:hypothetical protein
VEWRSQLKLQICIDLRPFPSTPACDLGGFDTFEQGLQIVFAKIVIAISLNQVFNGMGRQQSLDIYQPNVSNGP